VADPVQDLAAKYGATVTPAAATPTPDVQALAAKYGATVAPADGQPNPDANAPQGSAGSRFFHSLYDSTIGGALHTLARGIGSDELGQIHDQLNKGNYGAAALLIGKYATQGPQGRLAGDMVDSSIDQGKAAVAAAKAAQPGQAAIHGIAAVPMVGPMVAKPIDQVSKGDYAGAAGTVTGTGLSLAAPSLLEGTNLRVPGITNSNPTEAAALDYLSDKGVPVPAGARTGNQFVKNAQKAADVTPLGAIVAQRSEAATTQALKGEAANLASRASSTPVVPEQAGAGVRSALTKAAAQRAQEAQTSYDAFRELEKETPMPVDITPIKEQLAPIVKDMQTWMQPALRSASAGFTAAKSILDGPDVLQASQAEVGLGGLKSLAREGAGRNAGLAKYVVPQLQDAIDSAVSAADPHALIELRAGRTAAAEQYGTQAILDDIRQEPVQAFNQMTYAKDAGIDLLRKVQAEAPGEMRKVGRAWLENAFDKAQQEGGFGHASKLYSDWASLGPETKRVLFNPMLVGDLDKFFLGAKKLAENPNPSGTAVMGISGGTGALLFTHPQTGVPLVLGAGALSKLFHSPSGVRALTNGLKVSLKGPARAAAASQILKLAGNDMQPANENTAK